MDSEPLSFLCHPWSFITNSALTIINKEQIIANLSSYYLSYVYIRLNDYSSAKEILKSTSGHDIYSQICKLLYAEIEDYIITDINSAIDIYLEFLDIFESSIYYEDVRLRLGEIVS